MRQRHATPELHSLDTDFTLIVGTEYIHCRPSVEDSECNLPVKKAEFHQLSQGYLFSLMQSILLSDTLPSLLDL